MRRVWAAVMAVWALLALVGVLAWTRPVAPPGQGVARSAVVRTVNGRRQVVLLAPAAHATTQTSGAPARPSVVTPVGGSAAVTSIPAGGNN
jgi:hypothetical protein